LERLPESIGAHALLRTLLLAGNRLTALPVQLGQLGALTALSLVGNPLYFPPETVVAQGVKAVLAFLREFSAVPAAPGVPANSPALCTPAWVQFSGRRGS